MENVHLNYFLAETIHATCIDLFKIIINMIRLREFTLKESSPNHLLYLLHAKIN